MRQLTRDEVVGRALAMARRGPLLCEHESFLRAIESGKLRLDCENLPRYAECSQTPMDRCLGLVERWLVAWEANKMCKRCGLKPIPDNHRLVCKQCSNKPVEAHAPMGERSLSRRSRTASPKPGGGDHA